MIYVRKEEDDEEWTKPSAHLEVFEVKGKKVYGPYNDIVLAAFNGNFHDEWDKICRDELNIQWAKKGPFKAKGWFQFDYENGKCEKEFLGKVVLSSDLVKEHTIAVYRTTENGKEFYTYKNGSIIHKPALYSMIKWEGYISLSGRKQDFNVKVKENTLPDWFMELCEKEKVEEEL